MIIIIIIIIILIFFKCKYIYIIIIIILLIKIFNWRSFHGHHGSKRRELAQHTHSRGSHAFTHTLTVTSTQLQPLRAKRQLSYYIIWNRFFFYFEGTWQYYNQSIDVGCLCSNINNTLLHMLTCVWVGLFLVLFCFVLFSPLLTHPFANPQKWSSQSENDEKVP